MFYGFGRRRAWAQRARARCLPIHVGIGFRLVVLPLKLLLRLADIPFVQRSTVIAGVLLALSAATLAGVGIWVSGGFDAPVAQSDTAPGPDGAGSGAETKLASVRRMPSFLPSLEPRYTFRKTVPEVRVQFTAADDQGRLVRSLSPADVRIVDNHLTVSTFQHFERTDDLPLRLGLVLDVSDSMKRVAVAERSAALTFLRQVLRPETDRAFVMSFGSDVEVVQDSTSSRSELLGAVDRVAQPGNGTELYDALYAACSDHWAPSEPNLAQRVIVVVTDGDDTGSRHGLADVIAAAQRNEAEIYALTIHFKGRQREGDYVLKRLSEETGGGFYVAASTKEVPAIFSDIERQIRSQYYVSFRPEERTPGFHALRIDVRYPQGVQVRARQGYYAVGD